MDEKTITETVHCGLCGLALVDGVSEYRELRVNGEDLPVCCGCEETLFVCELCDETVSSAEVIDDQCICEHCAETKTFECVNCGERKLGDPIESENGDICESCYEDYFSTCESCDSVVRSDYTHNAGDSILCRSCFEESWFTCSRCGEAFSIDEQNDYDGYRYCSECYQRIPSRWIHSYSYKPDPIFYDILKRRESRTRKFFGIELEVENHGLKPCIEAAEKITKNADGLLYCKHDCTTDHTEMGGFEIVSHPFSWDHFKLNEGRWRNTLAGLREWRFWSHKAQECGMHVHVSKSSFKTAHLYKFLKLFYKNTNQMNKISQRKESTRHWANLEHKETLVYKAKMKGRRSEEDRHTAINLHPRATVEVRLFRGTLSWESFQKNLEMVEAAYQYSAQESMKKVSWLRFADFVRKNNCRNGYKNLYNFMKAKKLA